MSDAVATVSAIDTLEQVKAKFGPHLQEGPGPINQAYVWVERSRSHDVLRFLKEVRGFDFLMDVTAADFPDRDLRFDVIYNLYCFARNERFFVKVQVDDRKPGLPSATNLYKSANWFEREIWDMFGVPFEGHPDLRRILMYESFEGHPLRKDYDARIAQPLVPMRNL